MRNSKTQVKEILKQTFDHSRQVHWIFECGCEHKGPYFLCQGYRMCPKHRTKLKTDIITCFECGAVFEIEAKGRPPIFCEKCTREKHNEKKG